MLRSPSWKCDIVVTDARVRPRIRTPAGAPVYKRVNPPAGVYSVSILEERVITAPVALWAAFNTLTGIATLMSRSNTRNVSFGIVLGVAALSCALLSSGALHLFLGMEISLWALQSLVVLLALGLRPPGTDMRDLGGIAISSSLRLALALIVWLWV